MAPQEFYKQQSAITDPKAYRYLYDALPRDISSLCRVVQGLVLHYVGDAHLVGGNIPHYRLCEIDTRYTPLMLARLLEMDNRPLTEARTPENRIVGCCRDFSVLCCSMLRYFGVPARTRSGFATYFVPDYFMDHVVVEYWTGDHWQLVDPEIPPADHWGFDVLDVPRDRFIVGGLAWQLCRRKQSDPDKFGIGPFGPVHGWGFIRGRLMHDLAALNKQEMLCWDQWSYADPEKQISSADEQLLDRVAVATQGADVAFDEVRTLFADTRLHVPDRIESWSPAQDKPLEVALDLKCHFQSCVDLELPQNLSNGVVA